MMASLRLLSEQPRVKFFLAKAGGPWSISWQAYVVSLPFSLFVLFAAISKFADNQLELLMAGATALLTSLLLGLMLWGLAKTFFRNRHLRPVSPLVIGLSGLAAGLVFSVGIEFGKSLLGANLFEDLVVQIFVNSVIIVWWGATIAVVLDSRQEFARRRDSVIDEAIEIELVKVRGSATEQRLRESMNQKISSEISEARSTLDEAVQGVERSSNEDTWQPIALLIREIASDVMRPLSKKLWDSAAEVFPRPSFSQVLKTIINSQPLQPMAMTLIVLLLSTSSLINGFGFEIGLSVLLATIAFLWVSMSLANRIMTQRPSLHALMFLVTMVVFQIFNTVMALWAGHQAGVEVPVGTLIANIISSGILVVLTSGFGAFSNVNEASLKAFRQDVINKQIAVLVNNKVVSALALEASRNLHGRVQTRLLSCAAAIERATASGDIDLLNRALVEVNDIFDSAALMQQDENIKPLSQQIADISKRWDGLCAIAVTLDRGIAGLANKTASDLAEVIEEAITNAVRHGKSTQASIRVEDLGSKVGVTVSDNGVFVTDGAPGVGSELIRLISQGDFVLAKNSNGGAELRLSVVKAGY